MMDYELVEPKDSARQLGFRMPAEWEPLKRVWLTRPHNKETWPDCLTPAQGQFDDLLHQLQPYVQPCITQIIGIPTDDSWIRDYGPIFVTNQEGQLACHSYVFNCWGGKYEPYAYDNAVPSRMAQHLGIPVWIHNLVLEGGSIDVNGAGTVMTTRQCLLDRSRNPQLSREQIEQQLHEALGSFHMIWLPGGITGDDTDGHIDDVARFINPTTIAAIRTKQDHPDHFVLENNWLALQKTIDQDGSRLNLVELPVPDPIYYNYPADIDSPASRRQLPASYANFLFANQAVFIPIFGQHQDDVALRRLDDAMPGYTMIGVRCEHLLVGLGALHCLSMQQPVSNATLETSA